MARSTRAQHPNNDSPRADPRVRTNQENKTITTREEGNEVSYDFAYNPLPPLPPLPRQVCPANYDKPHTRCTLQYGHTPTRERVQLQHMIIDAVI